MDTRLSLISAVLFLSLPACASGVGSDEAIGTESEAMGSTYMQKGEYLFPNQAIWSSDCGYQLLMQTDGNLVVRNRNSVLQWYSHTAPASGAYAKFQTDGNFVLSSFNGGAALWTTGTSNAGGVSLKQQSDANVVMTNSGGGLVWNLGLVKPISGNCVSAPKWTTDTTVLANTDLPGADLTSSASPHIGDCGGKCAANASCNAWTWVPGSGGWCYLKSSVPASTNAPGMMSGRVNKICHGCI